MDAADLGGGKNHIAGLLDGEEGLNVSLEGDAELGVGANDDRGIVIIQLLATQANNQPYFISAQFLLHK